MRVYLGQRCLFWLHHWLCGGSVEGCVGGGLAVGVNEVV